VGAVIAIRKAEARDLGQVLRIERSSFGDPWSRESFESSLQAEWMRFYVAEEVGEGESGAPVLLGYVIALVLSDEAEIANIAVAPEARRRGLGGLLLDHATSDAVGAGVRAVYLEVRESNAGARALYDSRSFTPVGRRRRYYRNPAEDALLLRRTLAPT
jgi:[ribosomal protein S18]-alanine N-acetyltransferase